MNTPIIINIVNCKSAEADHKKRRRWYAHALHRINTICVCNDFYLLPTNIQQGIVIHEIGHIVGGNKATEKEADEIGSRITGIRIKRIDSDYGNNIQSVLRSNLFLKNNISNKVLVIWI